MTNCLTRQVVQPLSQHVKPVNQSLPSIILSFTYCASIESNLTCTRFHVPGSDFSSASSMFFLQYRWRLFWNDITLTSPSAGDRKPLYRKTRIQIASTTCSKSRGLDTPNGIDERCGFSFILRIVDRQVSQQADSIDPVTDIDREYRLFAASIN